MDIQSIISRVESEQREMERLTGLRDAQTDLLLAMTQMLYEKIKEENIPTYADAIKINI